jgi:hypothetical protein
MLLSQAKGGNLVFVLVLLALLAALMLAYYVIGLAVALVWGGSDCLPAHLRGQKHDDRMRIKSWMSREMTSRSLVEPPVMLVGSREHLMATARNGSHGPKPIPSPGHWQLSVARAYPGSWFYLPYFAFTTRFGLHFRIGTRWDDIDHYFTLDSFSIKLRRVRQDD